MVDVVSLVLFILGVILGFLALIKSFGNKSTLVGVVSLFVLLIGVGGIVGVVNLGGLSEVPAQKTFTAGVSGLCPADAIKDVTGNCILQSIPQSSSCSPNAITSNGKSQADVLVRNVENTTGIGYLTGTASANANGAFIDSVTTNAGGSGTAYASMSSIPNCGKGEIVGTVTTGTGFASTRKVFDVEKGVLVSGYDFTDKAVHKYELRGASTDVVNLLGLDRNLKGASNSQANGSVSDTAATTSGEAPAAVAGTGTADATAYFKNTSLGAKGSINFYIDLQVNQSSSVFGAYEEPDGITISYDTGTAAKFSDNSLSLQSDTSGWSLNKLAQCPSDVKSNRNVEACWSAPSIKVGNVYRIKGTIVADGGDPVASDTAPRIFVDDKVFFRDIGGNIAYASFSSSGGTNQGVGGTELRFVMG